MITRTAFQIGAFQFTGFQEAQTVGSGGWIWWDWLRAQAAAERKRKRKEEREPEPVFSYAEIIPRARLTIVARPIYTDLSALAARMTPLLDRDAELEELRAFMQMVAEMEET